MGKLYTYGCAAFTAVGSFMWGYDSGVFGTTIAQPSWNTYYGYPTGAILGGIISSYAGGAAVGCILATMSDRIGRRRTVQIGGLTAFVGTLLMAAAVNVEMLLVGRVIAGLAIGILYSSIPLYQSEIAPPTKRGFVVGLHTLFISTGFALANWIGYASYWSGNDFQFRFPMSFQCLPALILTIGMQFLPESPRWLIEQGRYEEAYTVTKRLHYTDTQDETFFEQEFHQMKEQITYEKQEEVTSTLELFRRPSYRKRILLAIFIQVGTQACGTNVVNYYQTKIYESVGIKGSTVLLLAALYGMVGPLSTLVSTNFIDRWGRVKATFWSLIFLGIDFIFLAALIATYSNKAGAGAAIAFLFLFSIIYSLGFNAVWAVYTTELFPMALRARGGAIATFFSFVTQIIFSQASPTAFENLGWKYYIVFIVLDFVFAGMVLMFCVETKGKTLEEINELFGERVVVRMDERGEVEMERGVISPVDGDEKVKMGGHIEDVDDPSQQSPVAFCRPAARCRPWDVPCHLISQGSPQLERLRVNVNRTQNTAPSITSAIFLVFLLARLVFSLLPNPAFTPAMPFPEARAIPRTISTFQSVLLTCYHIAVFQLWTIAFMFTLGPEGWSAFPLAVKVAYLVPYVVTGIFGVMPQHNIGLSDPIRTPTECVIRLLLLWAYWTLVHLLWAAAFLLAFVADDNSIWQEQRYWGGISLIVVVRTAFLMPMVITGCSGGWGWPNKQNMRFGLFLYKVGRSWRIPTSTQLHAHRSQQAQQSFARSQSTTSPPAQPPSLVKLYPVSQQPLANPSTRLVQFASMIRDPEMGWTFSLRNVTIRLHRDELLDYAPPVTAGDESSTELQSIGVTERPSVPSPDEPNLFTALPEGRDSEPTQEDIRVTEKNEENDCWCIGCKVHLSKLKLGEAFDVLIEKGIRENLYITLLAHFIQAINVVYVQMQRL
ncbi:hypothetical protein SAICODRAFT_26103 [Saitoella complicata NRRL Y-17804]|uniref:uncharacterized protein n=1 Tax=Saitoella complicata (strain BCRC 22490 / CBS 7301 / JCM 7358 / NBRC 10748 / NRRL Y-17804) TaxID=698492 RepID=UPI000867A9BF|nr:uncharacterized protein SAICODRAFT_26103 [Saitoella complicata NRRL Y-17804]ODQ52031.1 hypothetical protein SAICODRAFT_26103 [Saitoella complicata NRRL Y-17804]